jgi:hypothetical protein
MVLRPLEHGPRGIALLGSLAAAAGHLWYGLTYAEVSDARPAREAATIAWLWLAFAVAAFALAWRQGPASAPRRALLHALGLLAGAGAVYTMAVVPQLPVRFFLYLLTLFGGVAVSGAALVWAPAPPYPAQASGDST